MSTPYAGTATYHATIPLPADGDNRNATVLNAALEKIVDRTAFLNGGTTLAPAAAIPIGGSGIEMKGDLVTDTVYSPPRIELHGATGDLDVNSGGDINIKSGGDLIVESGGNIAGLGGSNVALAGTNDFSGTNTISGATTVTNILAMSGSGRIKERISQVVSDSNQTLATSTADVFWVNNTTLSTDREWTPSGDIGEEVTFRTFDATHSITVTGISTSGTIVLRFASGYLSSVKLKKLTASTWCVVASHAEP